MHKFSGIRGGAKMEDFIKIFKTNLLAGINFYDLVLNSSEYSYSKIAYQLNQNPKYYL